MTSEAKTVENIRPTVRCHQCRSIIFDGEVVKSRIVKVLAQGAVAKCNCKQWVAIPLTYRS
ncbi:MAG: hypothetical protein IBX57_07540 [Gammaproteobacteria bacterium]|nr:hypothetical protein [Gammaproteobacteria bacterium]